MSGAGDGAAQSAGTGSLSELKITYFVVNLKTFEGEPSALITHGVTTDAELYLHARLGFQEIASGDGWLAYRDPDVNQVADEGVRPPTSPKACRAGRRSV